MQTTGSANPELQMQAETYVGTGYQRLLTFEVDGGGFSLFGEPPAHPFLTAYGLMEFHDMSKVYPVDEAVIERAARWLLSQQQPDGTWQVGDSRAGQGTLGATSYVAWALIEAGYGDTPRVGRAISYIRTFALQEKTPYSLALAANAAGDTADAHYYMAEFHAMSGSLQPAIDQLQLALSTPDLDSVQQARFMARLQQFQEYLPDRPREESPQDGRGN